MRSFSRRFCKTSPKSDHLGVLSGILIVLIPKCSFCLVAYSGALALCSGGALTTKLPDWGILFLVLAGIAMLIGIILNSRGGRTQLALMLALVGIGLISLCQILSLDLIYHYLGSAVILFAIWTNGSFYYVYRALQQKISDFLPINY